MHRSYLRATVAGSSHSGFGTQCTGCRTATVYCETQLNKSHYPTRELAQIHILDEITDLSQTKRSKATLRIGLVGEGGGSSGLVYYMGLKSRNLEIRKHLTTSSPASEQGQTH